MFHSAQAVQTDLTKHNTLRIKMCDAQVLLPNAIQYLTCSTAIPLPIDTTLMCYDSLKQVELRVPRQCHTVKPDSKLYIQICNASNDKITLPNSTCIANCIILKVQSEIVIDEPIKKYNINSVDVKKNDVKECDIEQLIEHPFDLIEQDLEHDYINREPLIDDIKKLNLDHLNSDQKETLITCINNHREAFAIKESPMGLMKGVKHKILTTPGEIVHVKQYRIPQHQIAICNKLVSEMCDLGIVRPCNDSAWNSPILLVLKPNKIDYRIVLDLCAMNKVMTTVPFPIIRIDDALNTFRGHKYFSSLDCRHGFWQIVLDEESQEKTAFTLPTNKFCFTKLVMGLTNSSFYFTECLNNILKDALGLFAMSYIDDVVVSSHTFEEHIDHLTKIFKMLIKGGVKLYIPKCCFAQYEIKYLGFLVSGTGIRCNPAKVSTISEFPTLTNA